MQRIVFTTTPGRIIDEIVHSASPSSVIVLADENTSRLVVPNIDSETVASAPVIIIAAGDEAKTITTASHVWDKLSALGATRHSLLINVGGGMVTDLGGFAASTFKRGIEFINVPTTLLGAVDASVGGKTGVNHGGFKNEVGVFNEARAVVLSTAFFNTLPQIELRSGYAEVLKHALLIGVDEVNRWLDYPIELFPYESNRLLGMIETGVNFKLHIVEQDPHEQGLRRCLNLGHTVGHAFESFALMRGTPVPHGHAVARGLVAELILSHLKCGFDGSWLHRLAKRILALYGNQLFTCDDYPTLLNLMHHDKKSVHGEINCTLLTAPGQFVNDFTVEDSDMCTALDIYRDLME